MCSGQAPELSQESSFVGRWMDILRPGYERLGTAGDDLGKLEREAVLISLENLATFPFVQEALANERLSLHGLYTDIGEGGLEVWTGPESGFETV